MSEDAPTSLVVTLADEVTSGQITVSLEAYAEYCLRLDLELDILTKRFAAFAAPTTSLLRRNAL